VLRSPFLEGPRASFARSSPSWAVPCSPVHSGSRIAEAKRLSFDLGQARIDLSGFSSQSQDDLLCRCVSAKAARAT
jgi:hypothetical protein